LFLCRPDKEGTFRLNEWKKDRGFVIGKCRG
jgi:hypothetical protein